MNYEQKYKEALERARKLGTMEMPIDPTRSIQEQIFPELRESEDEKIRKALIFYYQGDGCLCTNEYRIDYKNIRTWLEKQGEQKQKVQPKFKIGDIIRFKGNETLKGEAETHKIVSYDNELYVFADGTTDLFSEQDLYELVEQKPESGYVDCTEHPEWYGMPSKEQTLAWSEEDERICQCLIESQEKALDGLRNSNVVHSEIIIDLKETYRERISWLKSLKDRVKPHWKPSKEYISTLEEWLKNHRYDENARFCYPIFHSLYNELKKL